MPQKKNPQALEHAKAATAQVAGALVAALASSKNTAFGDVNDGVTALNGPVLDACDTTARTVRLLDAVLAKLAIRPRSEEHTSELQSLMRISYAVFCLKKKKQSYTNQHIRHNTH